MFKILKKSFEGDLLDGLFNELLLINNNNSITDSNLIKLIPSDNICNLVNNIVKRDFKSHWFTFYPNPYLMIDFLNFRINVESYVLGTYSGSKDYGHLRSWKLLSSNDNTNWDELHIVNDSNDMNNDSAIVHFKIQPNKNYYKYIKIEMMGRNWANIDIMCLRHIEFFGSLVNNEKCS